MTPLMKLMVLLSLEPAYYSLAKAFESLSLIFGTSMREYQLSNRGCSEIDYIYSCYYSNVAASISLPSVAASARGSPSRLFLHREWPQCLTFSHWSGCTVRSRWVLLLPLFTMLLYGYQVVHLALLKQGTFIYNTISTVLHTENGGPISTALNSETYGGHICSYLRGASTNVWSFLLTQKGELTENFTGENLWSNEAKVQAPSPLTHM